MGVKERIRDLRKELQLSQEAAAQKSGLARTVWVKLEAGKNQASSFEIRSAIAKTAGVTVEAVADYLDERLTLAQLMAGRVTAGRKIDPIQAAADYLRASDVTISDEAIERVRSTSYYDGPKKASEFREYLIEAEGEILKERTDPEYRTKLAEKARRDTQSLVDRIAAEQRKARKS
jgi:DNA-binding XRE family transcriptional regulator